MGAASSLVEVVHVLCDDSHIEVFLQGGDELMATVRLRAEQFVAACVVEVLYEQGVSLVALYACHRLYGIFLPEAVAVAECADAAFGGHACTCQEYYFFHTCEVSVCGKLVCRRGSRCVGCYACSIVIAKLCFFCSIAKDLSFFFVFMARNDGGSCENM